MGRTVIKKPSVRKPAASRQAAAVQCKPKPAAGPAAAAVRARPSTRSGKPTRTAAAAPGAGVADDNVRDWPMRAQRGATMTEFPAMGAFHDGPVSLDGILRMPAALVSRLLDYEKLNQRSDISCELKKIAKHGLVLSSTFSGSGAFEGMVVMLMDEVVRLFQMEDEAGPIVFWSAGDKSQHARDCISKHSLRSRPRHIFGDVLDRLPDEARTTLTNLQKNALEEFSKVKAKYDSKRITMAKLRSTHEDQVNTYMKKVQDVMTSVTFKRTAWCYKHNKECCTSPREDPAIASLYWIEAAGSVCTAFSNMGRRSYWLDESALPYMTWNHALKQEEPDCILHECVPAFPPEALDAVLNGLGYKIDVVDSIGAGSDLDSLFDSDSDNDLDSEPKRQFHEGDPDRSLDVGEPKSLPPVAFTITSAPMPSSSSDGLGTIQFVEEECEVHFDPALEATAELVAAKDSALTEKSWTIFSTRFCPTDLGVPVVRNRRYSMCLRKAITEQLDDVNFKEAFFANMMLQGSVYMDAELDYHYMNSDMEAGSMTMAMESRKQGYQALAAQRGLDAHDFAVANLTQNAEYMGLRYNSSAPCLLRKSHLWNVMRNTPVHVAVHWLMQGFPHPSFVHVAQDLRNYFPFPGLVQPGPGVSAMAPSVQRSLAGNAMNWAAVAAAFLFCLGCTKKDFTKLSGPDNLRNRTDDHPSGAAGAEHVELTQMDTQLDSNSDKELE